jgi:hypothetical protein
LGFQVFKSLSDERTQAIAKQRQSEMRLMKLLEQIESERKERAAEDYLVA